MKLPKISLTGIAASFKTRSFRVGGYSVAATAIVLAIAVAVNIFAGALPSSVTQFDTTANQLFTISEQTENILAALDEEVTIYWIVQSGAEDSGVSTLLDRYKDLSKNIKVQKKDPDVYPTFVQQYTDYVSNNSLVVEANGHSRYIDSEDIYVYDYYSYYYYGTEDISFCGETELTSAIDYVTSENLPKIYTLTGHGESALGSTFSDAVDKENMETEDLSLLTSEYVPDDADCVLILAPQSDISENEKTMLQEYLHNGGNVVLITDPPMNGSLTNLEALTADYGISAANGVVVESNRNYYAWDAPYYLLPEINSHSITDSLISGGYYVLLPIAQGLTVSDVLPSNVSVTELLTTSSDAFSKAAGYNLTTYEYEEGDLNGPFALAVLATETVDDGIEGNVVWISSAAIVDDQTNSQVSGGNQDFFLNVLGYLCEPEESSLSIHAKSMTTEYLTMSSGTSAALSLIVVGLIPIAYLAVGVVIWFRRKRR